MGRLVVLVLAAAVVLALLGTGMSTVEALPSSHRAERGAHAATHPHHLVHKADKVHSFEEDEDEDEEDEDDATNRNGKLTLPDAVAGDAVAFNPEAKITTIDDNPQPVDDPELDESIIASNPQELGAAVRKQRELIKTLREKLKQREESRQQAALSGREKFELTLQNLMNSWIVLDVPEHFKNQRDEYDVKAIPPTLELVYNDKEFQLCAVDHGAGCGDGFQPLVEAIRDTSKQEFAEYVSAFSDCTAALKCLLYVGKPKEEGDERVVCAIRHNSEEGGRVTAKFATTAIKGAVEFRFVLSSLPNIGDPDVSRDFINLARHLRKERLDKVHPPKMNMDAFLRHWEEHLATLPESAEGAKWIKEHQVEEADIPKYVTTLRMYLLERAAQKGFVEWEKVMPFLPQVEGHEGFLAFEKGDPAKQSVEFAFVMANPNTRFGIRGGFA